MTYRALIDACSGGAVGPTSRWPGSDDAEAEIDGGGRGGVRKYRRQALFNEVGAWTAAITLAGSPGGYTAMRLFRTMQKYDGARPNSVTCGCLVDCLLRAAPDSGNARGESLVPGEVMYTSLMGVALTLADKSVIRKDGLHLNIIEKFHDTDRSTPSLESSGRDAGGDRALCRIDAFLT
ncbi:hypothetical protein ACHAW5_001738 [Stephanodiscus triporus]|uniref:Uncharacterized protein n=1 Tax=Stephanodiscus triporus TaxID=2934178 RepID=A0ABD3QW54_9STRA